MNTEPPTLLRHFNQFCHCILCMHILLTGFLHYPFDISNWTPTSLTKAIFCYDQWNNLIAFAIIAYRERKKTHFVVRIHLLCNLFSILFALRLRKPSKFFPIEEKARDHFHTLSKLKLHPLFGFDKRCNDENTVDIHSHRHTSVLLEIPMQTSWKLSSLAAHEQPWTSRRMATIHKYTDIQWNEWAQA